MKKNLLVLGFVFSLNAFSQTPTGFFDALKKQTQHNAGTQKTASIINLKDSTYRWVADTATNLWRNPDRTTYTYNALYKENGNVNSNSTAGPWQDLDNCTNYLYDSNNNLLGQTFQNWNGTSWENGRQITNTYDPSNNKLTEITQYWNTSSLIWINGRKRTYTYDSFNNKLSELNQHWNAAGSTWINDDYYDWYIYAYDTHNNLITSITKRWLNINMAWMNFKKDSASYNLNDEYTSFTTQYWSGSWVNSQKMTNIVYSAGDLVNYEWQQWNGTTFGPGSKYQDSYNSNHKIINSTTQYWQSTSGSWENNSKIDYTYDANDNQITYLKQIWYNSSWVNYYRIYDYYTSFVGINELTFQKENITVFPNPASNFITISSDEKTTFNEITIIDVTGKVIFNEEKNQTNSTVINVSKLEAGVYFIKLKNENSTMYKKFIKE